MNFEANRKKILADLRKEKSLKRAAQKAHSRLSSPSAAEELLSREKEEKVAVVIFGQKGPFLNNFISSLHYSFSISHFTDVDITIGFMMDNSVKHIIIDIDPPSDYHLGVNLFTVVKSLSSEIKVIVCTGNKEDSRSRSLSDHGCIVLQKPISIPELSKYIG